MNIITSWLAQKAVLIAVLVLALVGLVCGPLAAIQAVRINGVTIFGWHAVTGLKPGLLLAEEARDAAINDLAQSRANANLLNAALTKQNAAIADMGAQTYAKLAAMAALLAASDQDRKAMSARLAVYLAAPPVGADECARYKNVDARFIGGLHK